MHILLVEDDAKLGELIQYKLKKQLYQVEWAINAESALFQITFGGGIITILFVAFNVISPVSFG